MRILIPCIVKLLVGSFTAQPTTCKSSNCSQVWKLLEPLPLSPTHPPRKHGHSGNFLCIFLIIFIAMDTCPTSVRAVSISYAIFFLFFIFWHDTFETRTLVCIANACASTFQRFLLHPTQIKRPNPSLSPSGWSDERWRHKVAFFPFPFFDLFSLSFSLTLTRFHSPFALPRLYFTLPSFSASQLRSIEADHFPFPFPFPVSPFPLSTWAYEALRQTRFPSPPWAAFFFCSIEFDFSLYFMNEWFLWFVF